MSAVLNKIKESWYSSIPTEARPPKQIAGCVDVDFRILRDGTLTSVHLASTSGTAALDRAAMGGILQAAPVPALPTKFNGDNLDLSFRFFYNPPLDATDDSRSRHQEEDLAYHYAPVLVSDKGTSASGTEPSYFPAPVENIRLGTPVHTVDLAVPKKFYGKNAAAVLGATIKTDGSFTDFFALAGDEDFENAALDAVHQWRYTPATLGGNPVEAHVFVTFVLKQGEINTFVEPDLPLQDGPKRDMKELYARGELFAVDMQHVKPPKAVYSPDPEYSLPARIAKRQGVVALGLILGRDGSPDDIWVIRKFVYSNGEQKTFKPVGLGLEQKAIEAVRQWKFQPATKDGEPVPVFLNIEVQFRLY